MKPIFLIFIAIVLVTPYLGSGSFSKLISPLPEIISQPTLNNKPRTASASQMITFIAGGDVMLGRSVNTRSIKNKDYTWAFKNIAQEFSSADISLINLEAPFFSDCTPTDFGMIFCAPPEHLEGLKMAGIDIANLANNHIRNRGQEGVDYTISTLRQNNITPIGFEPAIKEMKGIKFGFLGFNAIDKIDESSLSLQIKELDDQVDILVATFHWGSEYSPKSDATQKRIAHLSVDAGADVIIGHHPHWVQEKEIYLGKPIYYSLGNLIFDQAWSDKTQEGLVVKMFFSGKNYLTSQDLPVRIFDFGQPRFVNSVTLK